MFSRFGAIAAIALASPSLAKIYAVDSSITVVPQSTYAKAMSEGFSKVIIRGYFEACAEGGSVDPSFVDSYNNAVAAGYRNIDTYWFPCTGPNYKCKPFAQQIAELGSTISNNHMNIGRIWVDFEVDRNPKACIGNWDYGHSGSLAVAREIVSAIRGSGYVWGIYSSPGEWNNIFGSPDVVLDNSVPLWFATYDNSDSLYLDAPFGGWSGYAAGHQYSPFSASGLFDLNVFAS